MLLSDLKRFLIVLLFAYFSLNVRGQSGPAGVGSTSGSGTLSGWYDANQTVTLSGSAVTQWNDQSGYGNHATPPASSNQPTLVGSSVNGYPVITFDGSNDFLTAPDASSLDLTNWSIVIVGIVNLHKNYNAFLVKGADASENYEFLTNFPATGNIHYPVLFTSGGRGIDSEAGEVFSTSTYGVYQLDYDQTNFEFHIDGNQTETDSENRTPQTNASSLYIGNEQGTSGRNLDGSLAEVIIYSSPINAAERLILHNAMAAKYGFSLSANDFYNEDNAGNGNYDHDVAGIGRVDASNIQNDAQGTGIVRILNPLGLGDDEFLMWGHDNGALNASNTVDVPIGVQARFERVWRVSEVNASGNARNVGIVDVRWDLSGLDPVTASDLRLLIDTDNDGVFSDEIALLGATSLGGNIYEFALVPGGVLGIRNNRRFTLGTINVSQTPLPIELKNFEVKVQTKGVAINWTTASETNNDFFTIQRSSDGQEFEDLFHIQGAGNSSELLAYDTIDWQPLAGRSFYRLKQTDFDGKYSFSPIESVVWIVPAENFEIFPIPASNILKIRTESENAGEAKVSIFDSQGSIRLSGTLEFNSGTQLHSLPLPQIGSGLYYIRFQGKSIKTIPLLINK